jgi:hypothetical protein
MVEFVRRRRALTTDEQDELRSYLREVGPLVDQVDHEYETWKRSSWGDSGRMTLDNDPTGENAAVYVWRVSDPATKFVQHPPVPLARRYHRALSLCLEARASAASYFKDAADTKRGHERDVKLAVANRRLRESQTELNRALKALSELHDRLAGR